MVHDTSSQPILVLPGLNGSLEGHWQQHWLTDFAGSEIVEQEDWSNPNLAAWIERVETRISAIGKDVFLIGHSLGCILAAHLSRGGQRDRIKGAMLVAPCDLDIVERLHPGRTAFGAQPDWKLSFPTLLVGSDNDHYMPLERLHETGAIWDADLASLGNAGHINIASGFGRWPEGYRYFERLKERVGA